VSDQQECTRTRYHSERGAQIVLRQVLMAPGNAGRTVELCPTCPATTWHLTARGQNA